MSTPETELEQRRREKFLQKVQDEIDAQRWRWLVEHLTHIRLVNEDVTIFQLHNHAAPSSNLICAMKEIADGEFFKTRH